MTDRQKLDKLSARLAEKLGWEWSDSYKLWMPPLRLLDKYGGGQKDYPDYARDPALVGELFGMLQDYAKKYGSNFYCIYFDDEWRVNFWSKTSGTFNQHKSQDLSHALTLACLGQDQGGAG